jgi:Ca2+-binding EF-hand superfamily protein
VSTEELKEVCGGSNSCTFDAFKTFMNNQPRQAAAAVEIKNSVHILAQSSGGTMRTAELRLLLTSQGEKLAHDEAATVVADADPRKTGYVDVEPFADLIASS